MQKKAQRKENQMSSYLLSGWTMTADHCEKCLIPLLKKNQEIICVNCSFEEKQEELKKSVNVPSQGNLQSERRIPEASKGNQRETRDREEESPEREKK